MNRLQIEKNRLFDYEEDEVNNYKITINENEIILNECVLNVEEMEKFIERSKLNEVVTYSVCEELTIIYERNKYTFEFMISGGDLISSIRINIAKNEESEEFFREFINLLKT